MIDSCRMSVCAALGARARNARDRTPIVEGEEVNAEDESLSAQGSVRGKGRVANKAQGHVDENEDTKPRDVIPQRSHLDLINQGQKYKSKLNATAKPNTSPATLTSANLKPESPAMELPSRP
jgi:hypothetical protein